MASNRVVGKITTKQSCRNKINTQPCGPCVASKRIVVGKITTKQFDDFLIIPLSKDWLSLNDEKPIEFFVEVKEGKLILSSTLASLDRTRSIVTNVM